MLKLCPNCNEEVEVKYGFCPECGEEFKDETKKVKCDDWEEEDEYTETEWDQFYNYERG